MPRKLRFLFPFAMLTLASCSLPRYPVEGKVTLDGQPLKAGTVVFWPGDGKEERSTRFPSSPIGEDGRFALHTDGAEGAPVGTYKVTVIAEDLADSTKPEKTRLLVPRKYTSPETTPLSVKVVQFPNDGAYDLQLTRK
jgi:hypothetical protein